MKMFKRLMACTIMIGAVSCGNPGGNQDDMDDADSILTDSIADDSLATDTTTDSLASPSFP
ncbi:hypothetical protein [Parapedobacter sp. DT-150]|uniref:hypothetical protein n=1 Tax=Parapedobacter sp. DT-150 TaxID=3396162 RepID=UPI003F542174